MPRPGEEDFVFEIHKVDIFYKKVPSREAGVLQFTICLLSLQMLYAKFG